MPRFYVGYLLCYRAKIARKQRTKLQDSSKTKIDLGSRSTTVGSKLILEVFEKTCKILIWYLAVFLTLARVVRITHSDKYVPNGEL
jgi:hypothetical protein